MKLNIHTIPGMRQPTEMERTRVSSQWRWELQKSMGTQTNKTTLWTGIALIALGVGCVLLGKKGLAAAGLCVLFGCVSLFRYRTETKRVEEQELLLRAFDQGNFMVAPAVSTKIYCEEGQTRKTGLMQAKLPSGEPLDGIFRAPYNTIEPLLRQNIHSVQILLVQVPGFDEAMAALPPVIGRMKL